MKVSLNNYYAALESCIVKNKKKRYEYYSYDIDDCPEWSLVMYELVDNNNIKNNTSNYNEDDYIDNNRMIILIVILI